MHHERRVSTQPSPSCHDAPPFPLPPPPRAKPFHRLLASRATGLPPSPPDRSLAVLRYADRPLLLSSFLLLPLRLSWPLNEQRARIRALKVDVCVCARGGPLRTQTRWSSGSQSAHSGWRNFCLTQLAATIFRAYSRQTLFDSFYHSSACFFLFFLHNNISIFLSLDRIFFADISLITFLHYFVYIYVRM